MLCKNIQHGAEYFYINNIEEWLVGLLVSVATCNSYSLYSNVAVIFRSIRIMC